MMNQDFSGAKLLLNEKGINFVEDELLSLHSTFRIGGKASLFIKPETEEQLISALSILKSHNVRTFVLGNGSNVLFDDSGFRGAVISTAGLHEIESEGTVVRASCGVSLSALAVYCAEHSLSGLEFLYGIPGSVGGGVYMNAGAYGGEISECLVSSKCYDPENDRICTLDFGEHDFGYRKSVFNTCRLIHLSSEFSLISGNSDEIKEKMADFLRRRKEKQPLEYPSAGSTFKRYPGRYTGQMIEEAGLKGLSVGGAQVSEKHAGFIINKGNATARDVLSLVETVKEKIKEIHGVEIECEMIYVKNDE